MATGIDPIHAVFMAYSVACLGWLAAFAAIRHMHNRHYPGTRTLSRLVSLGSLVLSVPLGVAVLVGGVRLGSRLDAAVGFGFAAALISQTFMWLLFFSNPLDQVRRLYGLNRADGLQIAENELIALLPALTGAFRDASPTWRVARRAAHLPLGLNLCRVNR